MNEITIAHQEFQIAELIREKVYLQTEEELPYRTVIELDSLECTKTNDGRPFLHIKAAVVTPNHRYQRMLIGAGAQKIGASAPSPASSWSDTWTRRCSWIST